MSTVLTRRNLLRAGTVSALGLAGAVALQAQPPVAGVPLSTADLNRPYQLVRVLLQDAERLSYLTELY